MIRKFGGSSGIEIQPQGIDLGIGGSNIKSIQRGTATIAAGTSSINVAISKVDLAKAIVKITFLEPSTSALPRSILTKAILTDSLTLTLSLSTYTATTTITIEWEVIEFNNVKSLQSGTLALSSSLNATISAVNVDKSILYFSVSQDGSAANNAGAMMTRGKINTPIQLSFLSLYQLETVAWQVIEFN